MARYVVCNQTLASHKLLAQMQELETWSDLSPEAKRPAWLPGRSASLQNLSQGAGLAGAPPPRAMFGQPSCDVTAARI